MTSRPCARFSDRDDIPRQYSRYRKGKFGVVEKTKCDGEARKRSHIHQAVREHSDSSLYIYCCIKEKREESEKKYFAAQNKAAERNVIKTTVYLSMCTSVYISLCTSVCVPLCTSVCVPQSVYLYVPQSVYLYVPQSVYLSLCTSMYLSLCTSVFVPLCTSVCDLSLR
jgi:hypothetical protein